MLLAPEQLALVLPQPYAIPSTVLSSYLTHPRPVVGAKKLRQGLLDSVQTVLLALVSKLRLLPAAALPPLLALVPPAVLERTGPAALLALVRTQPLQVQVEVLEKTEPAALPAPVRAQLLLVLVQRAVVHLK